jgi:hypothetical protein
MEAPEKIYIDDPTGEFNDHWSIYQNNDSIEYTRTDTFIEKAIEWLKENKYHPFIGCEDCCLSGFLTDEFIEEFRKVMKGE